MKYLQYEINLLNNYPRIYTVDNFLSKEECNHLINIGIKNLTRAGVVGEQQISSGRTNYHSWINLEYDNNVINIIRKISELIQIDKDNLEQIQFLSYENGQKYNPHYDAFELDCDKHLKNGGQRMVTALIYLNEVEEGGETEFPNLNIKSTPKLGKLLVFCNTIKNSDSKHMDSIHAALPVTKGRKFAINLWFRKFNRI